MSKEITRPYWHDDAGKPCTHTEPCNCHVNIELAGATIAKFQDDLALAKAALVKFEQLAVEEQQGLVSQVAKLTTDRDALLAACEAFVGWNENYPSHTIYGHSEIVKIAAELDKISKQAAVAIAQANKE